jgi:NitT/TauT family transport system substrate-binding protein
MTLDERVRAIAASALILSLTCCAQSPKAVSLRIVTFQGAEAPLLAQKLGLFAKAGLQVDLQETQGTAKAMEALLGGSADSIVGTFEQAIQLRAQGKAVVAYRLLTECHCLALVVPPTKTAEIRAIGDLAGKTVGVGAPGGAMQNFVSFLLTRAGKEDASYVAIGVGASAFAAIEGGKVDAAVVLASTLGKLRERYPSVKVLAETFSDEGSRQAFGFAEYPAMALMAQQAWLDKHPDAARRAAEALGEAVMWIRQHSAEEVRATLGNNLDLGALKLHLPRYSAAGEFSLRPAEFVRDQLIKARRIPAGAVPDVTATYSNAFVKRNPAP